MRLSSRTEHRFCRHVHPSSSRHALCTSGMIPFFPPAYTAAQIFMACGHRVHKTAHPFGGFDHIRNISFYGIQSIVFVRHLSSPWNGIEKGFCIWMQPDDRRYLSDRTLFLQFSPAYITIILSATSATIPKIMRNQQNDGHTSSFFCRALPFQRNESAPGSLRPKMWLVHQQSTSFG